MFAYRIFLTSVDIRPHFSSVETRVSNEVCLYLHRQQLRVIESLRNCAATNKQTNARNLCKRTLPKNASRRVGVVTSHC